MSTVRGENGEIGSEKLNVGVKSVLTLLNGIFIYRYKKPQ